MLLKVVLQRFSYGGVHHTGYLAVTELGLSLTLKLRLGNLDTDHCRQTLAEVVGVDGRVAVFIFELGFLEHLTVLGVLLHHAGKRSAESRHVRTAFDSVDIVHVRVYVLVEICVVDHRYFHRRAVLVGVQVDDFADERRAVAVDEAYELTQTFLRVERLTLATYLFRAVLANDFFLHAFVLEHDLDACVQVSELAHTFGEYIPLIDSFGEDRIVRPKLHERTGLAQLPVTCSLSLGDDMHRCERFALGIVLAVDSAFAIHLNVHLRR